MFANYANLMADFIISRAFILLLISIFLFPLIVLTTPSTTQQDLALSCHQELSSYEGQSSLISNRKATIETQIPPNRPSSMQMYTISFLAWWVCPPRIPLFEPKRKKKSRKKLAPSIWMHFDIDRAWHYLSKTCLQTICRTLLLTSLWLSSPQWLPSWLICLPVVEWMVSATCLAYPALAHQPEVQIIRGCLSSARLITFWSLVATIVYEWLDLTITGPGLGLDNHYLITHSSVAGFVVSKPAANSVPLAKISIEKCQEDDKPAYQINLSGEFYFRLDGSNLFWKRMVIIFLRQLQSHSVTGAGRPTRDGRRPLVSQTRLAEAFNLTQPEISLWEKYWLNQDWPNLLSLKSAQILTVELRSQIVEAFASRPWWGTERVYQHLHEQGIKVTKDQIQQAATDSGWRHLRQTLNRFFVVSEENIRPRDEALLKQLLNQLNDLLQKLKNSDQLTSQEELDISYLSLAAEELGVTRDEAQVSFWGQKIKNVLFYNNDSDLEKPLCCPHCGSDKVRQKGKKGYQKRYLDQNNEWQTESVFPHYCDNSDCKHKVFTNLPENLLPHSPYSLDIRLRAFYLVAVLGGSYRRVGAALGVKSSRIYEWVSAHEKELLPMAALFGVVRSSGVIGIDEKYVQVPVKSKESNKNKKRRWMYVYLAVDVYTYDLLHIDIYAHNTADSTEAFLLALKSKGYQPKVIVTDLRKEYGPAIKTVFKAARHHECIFHALQWWGRKMKEIYGSNYEKTHPQVVELKQQLIKIFQTTSKRTAKKRYEAVMARKKYYVLADPKAVAIFDSLERHWPKLGNAIESTIIPKTNNAVELVIRRFDQHYSNFCGFDSQESARTYLGVFEKAYRFTPFTDDARLEIRGKCPLELAGYDISCLPMTQICRGWALNWPPKDAQEAL